MLAWLPRAGVLAPRAALLLVALVLPVLTGCATQALALRQAPPADIPARAELADTPFHPQQVAWCGPATLAMALGAAGIDASPEAIAPQVYLPARQGSLQVEMLAATRRLGALPVRIPGRLEAVLREVAAGTPVAVLQNLALSWAPQWHYALVVGYDLERDVLVLRSGDQRRQLLPLSTFEHTWRRAGAWAFVAMPPGRLPATADRADVTASLVAFEQVAPPDSARRAYGAAVQRWPDEPLLHMGLGNAAYRAGDRPGAAAAFATAVQRWPDSGAAVNNLAVVLAELGRRDEARALARRAAELPGDLDAQPGPANPGTDMGLGASSGKAAAKAAGMAAGAVPNTGTTPVRAR